MTWFLVLLGVSVRVSIDKGGLLGQGVLIGVGQHLLGRPRGFHDTLGDQGQIHKSLLEEHDDGFVIDLQDDISFVAEALDEFLEGLSLLLYDDV
jgi:hypothetical protein